MKITSIFHINKQTSIKFRSVVQIPSNRTDGPDRSALGMNRAGRRRGTEASETRKASGARVEATSLGAAGEIEPEVEAQRSTHAGRACAQVDVGERAAAPRAPPRRGLLQRRESCVC